LIDPADIVEPGVDAHRAAIPGLAELILDVVAGDGRIVSATWFWKDVR
jgi:hypothetical protein